MGEGEEGDGDSKSWSWGKEDGSKTRVSVRRVHEGSGDEIEGRGMRFRGTVGGRHLVKATTTMMTTTMGRGLEEDDREDCQWPVLLVTHRSNS